MTQRANMSTVGVSILISPDLRPADKMDFI
jgi:hypothetical protein